jgi:hemoglobin-like flavoprotein
VAYGAELEQYPIVGAVLIASMAVIAGDAWTSEFELVWNEAFEIVAATMLEVRTKRRSSLRRDPKPLRSGPSPALPFLRPERAGDVSAR